MASTTTLSGDWLTTLGNRRMTAGTGNLGSYATSGVAVTAAQVGLGVLDQFIADPAGGYVFEYVASTGKVKAYVSKDPGDAGGANIVLQELANAVSLSGVTFNWRAIGR